MSLVTPPKYVALNGYAEVGKSTVQKMLEHHYAIVPADDGKPLREGVKALYSLDDWHVYTHEGKRSLVDLPDELTDVRQLLGDIGLKVEDLHGPDFIPWAAIRAAEKPYRDQAARAEADEAARDGHFRRHCPVFSFGSVRRRQGQVYQRAGGVVVEVFSPTKPDPMKSFDWYDRDLCDATILNDTHGLAALEAKVLAVFDRWFDRVSNAPFPA